MRSGPGTPHKEILLEHIVPGANSGLVPGDANPGGGIEAPDEIHFHRVELCRLDPIERRIGDGGLDQRNHRAVLGRIRVQEIHRPQSAGARHVIDDDVRLARKMRGNIGRERQGMGRIDPAGACRNPHGHLPSGIELFGRSGEGAIHPQHQAQQGADCESRCVHMCSSPCGAAKNIKPNGGMSQPLGS